MMPGEQNANAVRRNREIAARVRRLAEVVAQLAVEYEARPEPDAMENSAPHQRCEVPKGHRVFTAGATRGNQT